MRVLSPLQVLLLFPHLSGEDTRETFYEGAFLNMLFKKLQRLLDQVSHISLYMCIQHDYDDDVVIVR